MDIKDIQSTIKNINIEFDIAIQNLANNIYVNNVVPFCIKYGLEFNNDMGYWSFTKDDKYLEVYKHYHSTLKIINAANAQDYPIDLEWALKNLCEAFPYESSFYIDYEVITEILNQTIYEGDYTVIGLYISNIY